MHRRKFACRIIDPTERPHFVGSAPLRLHSLPCEKHTHRDRKKTMGTYFMSDSTYGNGSTKLNSGNFRALPGRFCINLRIMSSHRIMRPIISATGMAGNPISNTSGSEFSIITKPSLCPITCSTVTAPYVTAVQYNDPTMTLAARNGLNLFTIVSIPSNTPINVPMAGNTMMYSV